MSSLKAYQEFLERQKEAQKMISSNGADVVTEMFQEMFDAYPEVTEYTWYQYTPGFNDGDPCEFTMGESAIKYTKDFYESFSRRDHKSSTAQVLSDIVCKLTEAGDDDPDRDVDSVPISEIDEYSDRLYELFDAYVFCGNSVSAEYREQFPCLRAADFNIYEHKDLFKAVFGTNKRISIRRGAEGAVEIHRESYDCGH